MYCSNCGKKLTEGADFCLNCGKKINNQPQNIESDNTFAWGILGFFVPIVGLVLFIIWKSEKPKAAKSAGLGALISAISSIVLVLLLVAIPFMIFSSTPDVKSNTDYRCSEASCSSCISNYKTCTYFDGEDFEIINCPCDNGSI